MVVGKDIKIPSQNIGKFFKNAFWGEKMYAETTNVR